MKRGFFSVHKASRLPPCLYPSDKASEDMLSDYKHRDIVRVQITKPRRPKHHRKYWAMLGLVHEASAVSDIYPTTEHLNDAIKGALGYWSEIRLPDGKVYKKVDSIAYESMDQTAFEDFYKCAVDVIVTQIVPHMNREDLEREVLEMVK